MKKLTMIFLVIALKFNSQGYAQAVLNIPVPPPPPGSGLKPPPSAPGTRLVVVRPGELPPAPFSQKHYKKRKVYARNRNLTKNG